MENRFEICCLDSLLIGTRSECDRLSCTEGKHAPVFNLYYHKVYYQQLVFLLCEQRTVKSILALCHVR